MNYRDGWIEEDMLIFNELGSSGYASKGYIITPKNTRNASITDINTFGRQVAMLLSSIPKTIRVQIKWGVSSNYSDMLDFYDSETDRLEEFASQWCLVTRKEISSHYRERMMNGELRREKLIIYASTKINSSLSAKEIENDENSTIIKDRLVRTLKSTFANFRERMVVLGNGTVITEMKNDDYIIALHKFFNRSSQVFSETQMVKNYDRNFSFLSSAHQSDVVGFNRTIDDNYSLYGDNLYQDILVIKRLPEDFSTLNAHFLTYTGFLDYEITVNIVPLDSLKKMKEEEKLRSDMIAQQRDTDEVGVGEDILAKADRIRRLKKGDLKPFKIEFIIHVWATERSTLSEKVELLKAQVLTMGAEVYQPELSNQAISLLSQSQSGYPWGAYNGFALDADSDHARLFPFTSTFVGWTDPEAIYDGDNGNLIGIKEYLGTSQPQHTLTIGSIGSGKSALGNSIMTQTELYYFYNVIIDEGGSYSVFAALLGSKPIVFSPNSNLTINYFDTNGLPLTSEDLANTIGLLNLMLGKTPDEEYMKLRAGILDFYLQRCYKDAFEDWSNRNSGKLREVATYLIASNRYLAECPSEYSIRDSYLELKEVLQDSESKYHTFAKKCFENIDRDDVEELMNGDGKYAKEMWRFVMAWFSVDDFPTHSDLVNTMFSEPDRNHDREQLKRLATLLRLYCAGGAYGVMLDGPSNVNLKSRLVYFDLSKTGEASDIKSINLYLLTNHIRTYMMSLPRKLRKRISFEEMARFKEIPSGAAFIKEILAQLRKYGVKADFFLQQFEQIADSNLADILLGNTSSYLICQQKQRRDLLEFADPKKGIDLPETTQQAIVDFINPAALPSYDRYASFCYVHNAAVRHIGICRNYCSAEMLYVSSVSGDSYEETLRHIQSYDDPLQAVYDAVNSQNGNHLEDIKINEESLNKLEEIEV